MFELVIKARASRCHREGQAPRKSAGELIFETARDLFYSRGVRAVGVDEIVHEAGVTKPSLYRAYASKDDLVAVCLDRDRHEKRRAISELLEASGPRPEDQLDALLGYYARLLTSPGFRGCALSNTAVEFPEAGHPGRAVAEAAKADMRETLLGLTRQLAICEPEVLADGLMLVIEGAMASHHLFGSQGPSSSLLATGRALIATHLATAGLGVARAG